MAAQGLSVVYVTHRLGEVFEIAHRVTVMRNGRQPRPAADRRADDAGADRGHHRPPARGDVSAEVVVVREVVLVIADVLAEGLVEPASLTVREGEILGLAGQTGSGNGVLLRTIAGDHSGGAGSCRGRNTIAPADLHAASGDRRRHRLLLGGSQARRDLRRAPGDGQLQRTGAAAGVPVGRG